MFTIKQVDNELTESQHRIKYFYLIAIWQLVFIQFRMAFAPGLETFDIFPPAVVHIFCG